MQYSPAWFKVLITAFLVIPAGVLAMEKPSFIDCNGKEVTLNRAQQEAFDRLQLIKDLREDLPGRDITFAETEPFLNAQNIINLLAVVKDPESYESILAHKNVQTLIDLFRTADYLGVSDDVLESIAEHAYKPLKRLNQQLKDKKQEDDNLVLQQEIVEDQLLCHKFLEIMHKKGLLFLHGSHLDLHLRPAVSFTIHDNHYVPVFSENEALPKKMKSIKGIDEAIELVSDAKKAEVIDLEGHEIKEIDIDKLIKTFAYLKYLNVPSNKIASLTVNNPSRFNGLVINAKYNPLIGYNVIFKQTPLQEILTWFKALGAQAKIACFDVNKRSLLGWCACYAVIVLSELFSMKYEWMGLKTGDKQLLINIYVKDFIKNIKNERNQLILRVGIFGYLLERSLAFLTGDITRQLDQAARDNPYAVRVKVSNLFDEDFPSPYSYKLFGKNN
jgi:hypothetical protein